MELNSTLPLSQSPNKAQQPLNNSSPPSKLPIKCKTTVDNRDGNTSDLLLKFDFRPLNLSSHPCTQSPNKTQQPLNNSSSPSKLPIKRKTPENEPFIDPNQPPFKFHRIWTEPDEIRFLQGLLNGSSKNMFFPRDLNAFYTNFSNTMSQPYTKNQLSEKLRRLRKKFRVISTRLAKGLDMSLLSPHDRSLYDLSKQLWHPDFAQTSPFNADKSKKSRPKNDPDHDPTRDPVPDPTRDGVWVSEEDVEVGQGNDEKNDGNGDGNLREVNVELENGDIMGEKRVDLDGPVRVGVGYGIGDIAAAKVVVDVFDECLNYFRKGERSNLGGLLKEESAEKFEERWREQRVAELDVLSRRLRLVLEHSLQSQ